ncbi:MAG: hypothetical protein D6760_00720 [Deltaproteobacteria bacterium]|nr:MAG: hypothetical protein D6760_00720 [Deltaproteobacteria bacterium]
MSEAEQELKRLLRQPEPSPQAIRELLDGLDLRGRIEAVRSLQGRGLQRALWRAVESNARVSVADLVPPDYPSERPVVFHGKNSLPAFTNFEKICFRPEGGPPDRLWGYNETPIKGVIGPGYYVLRNTPEGRWGGCAFDYTQLPERGLAGWPTIRPNSAGLSRFIYNGTVDYMRQVAADVFIGQATRGGGELDTYFVVARELRD